MREVARSRNLHSGFVTTLKRHFESVMGTLFCLLLYMPQNRLGQHEKILGVNLSSMCKLE